MKERAAVQHRTGCSAQETVATLAAVHQTGLWVPLLHCLVVSVALQKDWPMVLLLL